MRWALTVRSSGSPGPAPSKKTVVGYWQAGATSEVAGLVMGGPRWSGERALGADRAGRFQLRARVVRRGPSAGDRWSGARGNIATARHGDAGRGNDQGD